MNGRNWLGYLVWGLLAYGLTKVVADVAARFDVHVNGVGESILYGVMVVLAAWLLVQVYDASRPD